MSLESPILPAEMPPGLRVVLDDYFARLRALLETEFNSEPHSVKRWGAKLDGITDDAPAIQAALDSGERYISMRGFARVASEFTVPRDVYFDMAGALIKPLTNTPIMRLHGGAVVRGFPTIQVKDTPGWNSSAVRFLGTSESTSGQEFRIPEKTWCEVRLEGFNSGSGNGKGVEFFAEDDLVNDAWIMGVYLWAKIRGFDIGIDIYKQGTDIIRTFINQNHIWADCGACLQALVMTSDHVNNYGTDSNHIEIKSQARDNFLDHTLPHFVVEGQSNELRLDPDDWVGGFDGTVPGIFISPYARRMRLGVSSLGKQYVQNTSTEDTVWIENDVDSSLVLPGSLNASVQTLSGTGVVSTTAYTTQWTTTGVNAASLADGDEGQLKIVVMVADGGDGTLTPTNLAGGTSLVFDAVGDTVTLQFLSGEWWVLHNTGVTVI